MKKKLCNDVAKVLEGITYEQLLVLMEIPADEKMGDFAIPCFSLAKIWRKNPAVIAAELREALSANKDALGLEKVENVGGYCNLFINREVYVKNSILHMQQNDFGFEKVGTGKTICMDYSSPNIAKNFHVGHL